MLYDAYASGGVEGVKKYIAENNVNINEVNASILRLSNNEYSILYTENPDHDYDFVKFFMDNGIVPTEKDLASAYYYDYLSGSFNLAKAMWEVNPSMDVNKLKFSMDENSPQQYVVRYLDDQYKLCDPSIMFQHMMTHGKLDLYKKVWIYSEPEEMPFIQWIKTVDIKQHKNGKNILKIRKLLV